MAEVHIGKRGEDVADQHAAFEGLPLFSLDDVSQPYLGGEVAADDIGIEPGEGDNLDVVSSGKIRRRLVPRRQFDVPECAGQRDGQIGAVLHVGCVVGQRAILDQEKLLGGYPFAVEAVRIRAERQQAVGP